MRVSHPLDESLIKALAHPLRWRILEILSERGEASPVEIARLLDQPLATISHHTRVLRDLRCIELTRTQPRRGAIEHYYRPVMPTSLRRRAMDPPAGPAAPRPGRAGVPAHRREGGSGRSGWRIRDARRPR